MNQSREHQFLEEWFPDDDAKDFFLAVRIGSRGDEAHFKRMFTSAMALLDEIEEAGSIDADRWDSPFTTAIALLVSLITHPGFLSKNDRSMDHDQYRKFILERVAILNSISHRYKALRARLLGPAGTATES
jgi:hypothetical protein